MKIREYRAFRKISKTYSTIDPTTHTYAAAYTHAHSRTVCQCMYEGSLFVSSSYTLSALLTLHLYEYKIYIYMYI